MKTIQKLVAILAVAMMLCSMLPLSATAATGNTYTVDFSSITGSVQYADETHDLGGNLSLHINQCHINTQLRIYSNNTNNGVATFTSQQPITKFVMNAGYKADVLNIYTSTDGSTWNLDQSVSVTSAYAEYVVELTAPSKYIQLDVNGNQQVRIAKMVFTFDEENAFSCDHTSLNCGETCSNCGNVKQHKFSYDCVAECENGCGEANPNYTDHVYSGVYDTICDVCFVEREIDNMPTAGSTLTIAEAIALGEGVGLNCYTKGQYYVTGKIDEVYNTQYGNMYITDGENLFNIYGSFDMNGKRYDAMPIKPVAGDTITIYGYIGNYNGSAQIQNGTITYHKISGEPERPVDPNNPQEYVFADYHKGSQNAVDEVHRLDNAVTVITNDAYFTSELRLYGYTGTTILQSTLPISAIVFKMGYSEAACLKVASSEDGNSYTNTQSIDLLTGAYRDDYVVTFDTTTYYVKMQAGNNWQVRIKSITLYFDGALPAEKEPCIEHTFTSQYDCTCNVCWQTIYTPEGANLPSNGSHISIATANAIGEGLDEGDRTTYSYYVTGIVTNASQSGDHLNLTISDKEGNTLSVPSILGGNPKIGDVITVYHPIQNYSGSAQVQVYAYIQNESMCDYDHNFDTDCNVCGMSRNVPTPSFEGNSVSEDVSGLAFRFGMEIQGIAIKEGTHVQVDFSNTTYEGYQLIKVGVTAFNDVDTIDIEGKRVYDLDGNMAYFAYRITNIPEMAYDREITVTPYFVVLINGVETTIYGEAQIATYNNALANANA